jgi:hypothetical protein
LKFKESCFIIVKSKKFNIFNKELTLINHYSADGAKRLIGVTLVALLEVKINSF